MTWREIAASIPGLNTKTLKAIIQGRYTEHTGSPHEIAESIRTGKRPPQAFETPVLSPRKAKIASLATARTEFAGVGTRLAKVRLNKLAKNDMNAKALRIALEIEDKNVSAKKYFGGNIAGMSYSDLNYTIKHEKILELIELCQQMGWRHGIHDATSGTTHVIYFHLPGVRQISWHFTPSDEELKVLPVYDGKWDKHENSVFKKLEIAICKLIA